MNFERNPHGGPHDHLLKCLNDHNYWITCGRLHWTLIDDEFHLHNTPVELGQTWHTYLVLSAPTAALFCATGARLVQACCIIFFVEVFACGILSHMHEITS